MSPRPKPSGMATAARDRVFRRSVPVWVLDLSLLITIGAAVRALPLLSSDFPLGDGGLFAAMTADVRDAAFSLPYETSYNSAGIPFAYPPLGFYVGAAVQTATGLSSPDLLRLLPGLFAVGSIPAFFLLSATLLRERLRTVLATFFFAVTPLTFVGPVMGGGLTRALGQMLALLALSQVLRWARQGRAIQGLVAGVLVGAASLAHPGFAAFVVLSSIILVVGECGLARGARRLILLGVVAAITTAPWVVTIVARHGVGGLLAPGGLRDPAAVILSAVTLDFAPGPIIDLITPLGLVGLLTLLMRRAYLLPMWLAAVLVTDSWSRGLTSSIPLAVLAAAGLVDGLGLRLDRGRGGGRITAALIGRRGTTALTALSAILVLTLTAALLTPSAREVALQPLPSEHRTAAAWIADTTSERARTAILTGDVWWNDALSEWFPELTGRRSVATVQGYEWFGRDAYFAQQDRYNALQDCGYRGASCLREWLRSVDETVDYLYVAGGPDAQCCDSVAEAIEGGTLGRVAYRGESVMIIEIAPRSPPPGDGMSWQWRNRRTWIASR